MAGIGDTVYIYFPRKGIYRKVEIVDVHTFIMGKKMYSVQYLKGQRTVINKYLKDFYTANDTSEIIHAYNLTLFDTKETLMSFLYNNREWVHMNRALKEEFDSWVKKKTMFFI